MKKYIISVMYRGQQITKMVCAKNIKEAANLLEVNTYFIKAYGYNMKTDAPFTGVIAYFDSGMLWGKEKGFIKIEMPLDELKALVDKHRDVEYSEFKKEVDIQ